MLDFLRLSDEFDGFRDLRIRTNTGEFVAGKGYLDGLTIQSPERSSLRFVTLTASFVCAGVEPALWNAPVLNLLSRFQSQQPIMQHRLRPSQPSTIPFCQFGFAGSTAFIDYFPDYEEKQERLLNGKSKAEVTCMMVGFVPPSEQYDTESILRWFPSDGFALLSLATGTSVGIGFIEVRNAKGQLHTRVHVSSRPEDFVEGPVVVGDIPHGLGQQSGLGPLISTALLSSHEAMKKVLHLTDAITAAKSELQTPERAYSTIVRALDGLSNQLQLNRRHLLQELTGNEPDQIRNVLVDAKDGVMQIAKQMELAGAISSAIATVRRIASRVEQADAIEDSFGLTLPRLLKHYGFQDELAIASCYATRPRYDGLTWPDALNKYRAGVIHKGHIDFSGGVPMADVVSITRHLIDVVTRICLKEIGYLGTYNPFNSAATQTVTADWVTSAQHMELFGLHGKVPSMFKRIGF